MDDSQTGVTGTLTDGTGVSPLTGQKLVKDFVADFLITLAATLGAGAGMDALDVGSIINGPDAALISVVGAFLRAGYRAALRWTQS